MAARGSLLDVFDEFCGDCQIGDCDSCDGGRCGCGHGAVLMPIRNAG